MHKPLKVLSLFLLFNVLTFSFFSCKKQYTDDGCGGSYSNSTTCVDVNDVTLEAYFGGYDTLKSGVYAPVYAIVAYYDVTNVICFNWKKRSTSFINAAYACSPVPPSLHFKDAVTSVKIITQEDFDSTHPAGSDITSYFTLPELTGESLSPEVDEQNRVGHHAYELEYVPDTKGMHYFTFQYTFASGRTIEKKDVKLNFNR